MVDLTEFVLTYQCLVALYIEVSDQETVHEGLVQAKKYMNLFEQQDIKITEEKVLEIRKFLIASQGNFDKMRVDQSIGARTMRADLQVKKEILGQVIGTIYTDEDQVVHKADEACRYEHMMSYYGTFPREELTEAQDRITEMMDEVDREHASRSMIARGSVRYSMVGTNKGDDDEETEDDNNPEDNPDIDDDLVQVEDDGLVRMDPEQWNWAPYRQSNFYGHGSHCRAYGHQSNWTATFRTYFRTRTPTTRGPESISN